MTTKLFISGKGSYKKSALSPIGVKVKKVLDGARDGELFSTRQLAEMSGVCYDSMTDVVYQLPSYTHSISYNKRYWGKPATVAQLKRETEHDTGHRRGRAADKKSTRRGA